MSYLATALRPHNRAQRLNMLVSYLMTRRNRFDALVGTGTSGLVMGGALADRLGVELVVVRKPHESSHGQSLEHSGDQMRLLMIDDFVETGATVRRVQAAVPLVGLVCYAAGAGPYALWAKDGIALDTSSQSVSELPDWPTYRII